MLRAIITVTVAVSVPNETIAGALAGAMRQAVEPELEAYYIGPDGVRSSIACDAEGPGRAKDREAWQQGHAGVDAVGTL